MYRPELFDSVQLRLARACPDYERLPDVDRKGINYVIYLLLVVVFGLLLPFDSLNPQSKNFIFVLGILGAWRYSWGATHLVRAWIFQKRRYPRIKSHFDDWKNVEIFVIVTTFRQSTNGTALVYQRLIEECSSLGAKTTIVARVSDVSERNLVKRIAELTPKSRDVQLHVGYQDGTGKRAALADALNIVAERSVLPHSYVAFVDGDVVVGPNTLNKAAAMLRSRPELGGVTVNEVPFIKGSLVAKYWFSLRSTLRVNLMSSMSLSDKVLVLTGRFSVYRTSIVTTAEFISEMRKDFTYSKLLGRIAFLTGDDKSAWFHLLRKGWLMMFVPDAFVYPLESLPDDRTFVKSSIDLMRRWYGNMSRNNYRAVALGPKHVGLFLYIALLDQRVSMWTSLVNPTSAILITIFVDPYFIAIYVFWVLTTKAAYSFVLYVNSGFFSPMSVYLLLYNQVIGSFVKIFASTYQHRQKWTRQDIGTAYDRLDVARDNRARNVLVASLCVFVIIMYIATM
jgi:glycosyltransferase Alg8